MYGDGESEKQSRAGLQGAETRRLCRHQGAAAADRARPDRRRDRRLAGGQPASACSASRSICSSSTTPSSAPPGAPISRPISCSARWCRPSSGCAHQGKCRFFGITANGETAALHRVIDARAFDTGQASYNLLNPSPGGAVPEGYPAQDYRNLLGHAEAADMGIIVIRVLAGGALERHRGAPSAGLAAAGADRLGRDLHDRCRARPPLRAAGAARATPTA